MNERIKLLAEQSDMTQYVAAENKYLERFAELIIKECADIIKQEAMLTDYVPAEMNEYAGNRLYRAFAEIKEHFGVEE